jgi:C-terminal processing protease CtpA/Prc
MAKWILFFWSLLWLCGSAQPLLTRKQMSEDLEQLRRGAQSAWSYRDYRASQGVDLDAVCSRLQQQLPPQASQAEFFAILREFTAAMQDGHAWLSPGPTTKWTLPGRFRDTDEGVVVAEWASDGCRVGDRLLAIDGQPVEECLREQMRRTSASTETARRSHAVAWLARRATPTRVRLELESPLGERTEVICHPLPTSTDDTGKPISYRVLADGTGYLRIPSFQQDYKIAARLGLDAGLQKHFALGREALAALHHCPALVIDLRGNPGGSDRLGQFLAGALLPEGSIYYELETHPSPELSKLEGFELLQNARSPVLIRREPLSPEPYFGRLALLCDEETFSEADCFLSAIVCNRPEAVVVGRPNGAGAGAPRGVVKLQHSQLTLTCCVMRVWTARGELLEGNSVPLDCEIRPGRADLVAGRDVQLEAALKLLAP